jgi:beta-glucosidase
VQYSEQLLVGYRWYDAHNVEPKFPFGHGLSYTTFEYLSTALAVKTGQGQAAVTFNVRDIDAIRIFFASKEYQC